MEREKLKFVKNLFGRNYLGLNELIPFIKVLGLSLMGIEEPEIPYSIDDLSSLSEEYILVLGISEINNVKINISHIRRAFGINSDMNEPCFYNQDWYIKEEFINKTLDFKWYLIRKNIIDSTSGKLPEDILKQQIDFPSAILCVYTFFAYYLANNEILWEYNFIWCNDTDHNGDRIYIGKYRDIDGINKNGFSIHRHLTIRHFYSAIDTK